MRTEKTIARQGHGAPVTAESMINGSGPAHKDDAAGVIDQVRELLFGEAKRSTEQGLRALEDRVEALTAAMQAQFSEVESRVADLARETERSQASAIDDIGSAIAHLGSTIRNMSGTRKAK